MKTLIVGAGAMGGLVGALLTESGRSVTLYDINREQVQAINEQGLVIERGDSRRIVKVSATTNIEEIHGAELIIFFVKSYDTKKALEEVKPCITQETKVLTLQNGEGNIETITSVIPSGQVFAGITSHGAMLLAPGVIRHSGGAETFIGPIDHNRFQEAEEIARLLNHAGMKTIISRDIKSTIWTKLIINAAINPLTAIIRCTNGRLLDEANLLFLMENIVEEGKRVAQAAGIKVSQDIFEHVKKVCFATGDNKSSMLMDIIKGRQTEIDAINGIIAKNGQGYGIPVPFNECMVRLVRGMEVR